MSKEASNAAKAAEEMESFRRDLELVLEDIVYRLHEGTEDGVSLDIQVLVGECQRLSSLLRLDRIPIRWGEYFKREPFRKHLTCGWPGVGEHPWSDLLSEESRTTAVSLCLVVTGPYEDDEEDCFLLAAVDLEEQYE
ncbi:MAG: hypothetical protein L6Q35_16970, partial [Phycisphaerales bacterium]|nr:hypothetical protein [Phycisphaerales bacterium]